MPHYKTDMYQLIKRNRRLPERQVLFYAVQIVLAVGYLHECGFIHRDLVMNNVFIDD